MTEDEHHARAMLLGLIYDREDHTYNEINEDGKPCYFGNDANNFYALDADTMEKVSMSECDERRNRHPYFYGRSK
jgi:hypothetical protein